MSDSPRIVAVTPGPPHGIETFSGISRDLLAALDERGALAAAVDGRPEALVLAEKAASFSPSRDRWKQRYNAGASPLSPMIRSAMSRVSSRRIAAAAPRADVVLQLTGYFNPTAPSPDALRCSYHDGNLAGFLRRSDLSIDSNSRLVARALAYERATYDSIDLIFCMSERLRESFVSDFGQAPETVVTVGAGANVRPAAAEHAVREPAPPRFLFVGKQFERKGGPTLVAAFRRLREQQPRAELWVVGPTDLRLDLEGVTVHGRISRDVPDDERRLGSLYESATAFVMPSVYEPLGIAVLEAMAYRLPCIGSTSGAIPELISEGVTGFLVEPGDEVALLDRMRRLAADPELGRRMGDAGFERYQQRFTWRAVAGRMLAAIDERRHR